MSEPTPQDRFLAAVRAIIRAELPNLTYLGVWSYTVMGVNGDGTVNAASSDPRAPLPALNNVPIAAGADGSTSVPTVGNECRIEFVNADPTRARVVGNAPTVKVATIDATDTVNVGPSVTDAVRLGSGDAPVARNGDAVAVYFGTPPAQLDIQGTFTVGSPTTAGSFTGKITMSGPACGVIITGAPKVLA